MRAPLKIAAAQPPCSAGDVPANAHHHVDAILAARARIVVFPELSLTGYELDAAAVSPDDDALTPVVEACRAAGTIALAGAPVAGANGDRHIAMLRIDSAGTDIAYRKTFLGGAEPGRFTPGDGPVVVEVDGWRIGVGICKDTGVDQHVAGVAALAVDLYVAGLVHLPEELDEQERRAVRIARACDAHVAFASFAGATGGGYDRTAGVSSIWAPDGTPIARAGTDPGDMARATLPISR